MNDIDHNFDQIDGLYYSLVANGGLDINQHLPRLRAMAEWATVLHDEMAMDLADMGCALMADGSAPPRDEAPQYTVVEMGVRTGVSTIALLCGRPKSMLSIDINSPPSMPTLQEVAKRRSVDWEFRQGSTLKMEPVSCVMLFIDTLHTYTQLKAELAIHGNCATKWLVFHDTTTFGVLGEDGQAPGLVKAIDEFQAANPHWKTKIVAANNNGLTVLERVAS